MSRKREPVEAKRLLAVLAHPDDETFICGGALAKYAQAGVAVTLLCATRGEMGRRLGVPPAATREGLGDLREQELSAACRALGIGEIRLMGLLDKTLDYCRPDQLAARIAIVMLEVKPHAVLTFHEKLGGHPDHCAIGRAATLAFKQAGGDAALYHLLWSDHLADLKSAGAGRERVTEIAVTGDAASAKAEAFRAHRSQSQPMEWLWRGGDPARRLAGSEYFLQGSGPARPGERDLLLVEGRGQA